MSSQRDARAALRDEHCISDPDHLRSVSHMWLSTVTAAGRTKSAIVRADARVLATVVADASGLTHFESEAASAGAELRRLHDAHADINANMSKLVRLCLLSTIIGTNTYTSVLLTCCCPAHAACSLRAPKSWCSVRQMSAKSQTGV